MIESNIRSAEIIPKGWGSETVFANGNEYCGKLLNFKEGRRGSMHFHLLKDETWYIAKGKIKFTWIDTKNGTQQSQILSVGDVVRNRRGQPHQVEAIEDSVIFEVSTQHFDEDTYRIESGDKLQ